MSMSMLVNIPLVSFADFFKIQDAKKQKTNEAASASDTPLPIHRPLNNYWFPVPPNPQANQPGLPLGYPLFPSMEHWPIGVNPWLGTSPYTAFTQLQGREMPPSFPYSTALSNSHLAHYNVKDCRNSKDDSICDLRLKAEEHKAAIKLGTKMPAD